MNYAHSVRNNIMRIQIPIEFSFPRFSWVFTYFVIVFGFRISFDCLFPVELVVDMGVSGGGVMTGEPSAAVCAEISARIRRSVSAAAAAAAAARWDAVAGAAMLLGSAIEGPGFDSRGSRDAARDMFTSATV
jgi:hypothetical protein